MTPENAHRVVNELRAMCDPRGYVLLDALEEYLVEVGKVRDIIEGHRVFADNDRHSRKAGLKAVQ